MKFSCMATKLITNWSVKQLRQSFVVVIVVAEVVVVVVVGVVVVAEVEMEVFAGQEASQKVDCSKSPHT